MAIICAFTGSFIGSRLVKKVTIKTVKILVGMMLMIVGTALAIGLV